jgi:GNAT superfamily N-acetyltransferase
MVARISWMTVDHVNLIHEIDPVMSIPSLKERIDSETHSGIVVRHGDGIVGYAVYEVHATSYEICRVFVEPSHRRDGFGTLMIESLLNRLDKKRHRAWCIVDEELLGSVKFFSANEFKAVNVLPRCFGERDGYWMSFDSSALAIVS